ncbi:pyruvate phosphate dikinase chloroplastic isoform X1 [Prunus yedoensis var. nudiflora]|uniref:Pyruvate phosphate dikinase chloroplastic isoform X1 n=1 Tax=Prunus yedoensis var. nudiflora TaxID=2094558 RepID=A0A314XXE4_PRUYE|nr:pyruvate phosphate dikinase chloroplastic isoform X1 [Prunus yedoensis var. nudiflora]
MAFTRKECHLDDNLVQATQKVRTETSPEDVGGMHAAAGILTARGGMTSHAAVVARGWGKCCVSGCSDIIRVNGTEKVVL